MAKKRSEEAVQSALSEDMSPEDQLARLDATPDAPTIREKEEAAAAAPAGDAGTRVGERRVEGPPTHLHSTRSASDALGKVPDGMTRCVIPDYDRFHVAGAVGDGGMLYGVMFIKDLNGDMVGDVPNSVVEDKVAGGQCVLESKHSPKPPATADEVANAQNRGRILAV